MNIEFLSKAEQVRLELAKAARGQASHPAFPLGQQGDPDLALLMRHHYAGNDLMCDLLNAYECEFIDSIWEQLVFGRIYQPSAAEKIIINAIVRKIEACLV